MRRLILFLSAIFIMNVTMANVGGNDKKAEPIVSGTVLDAVSKKPLPDVTITVTHTISKAEQTITTDANGNFKIPQLAIGSYKFKFEKDNFRTIEKNNIAIKQDNTTKINIELISYKDEEPGDSKNLTLKFGY